MNSRGARIALTVVGVLALVIGGVWAAQGGGLLPGSSMTGNSMWLVIGLVLAVLGIVMIARGLRRSRTRR